ncbi:glutathione S-transferase tpcF [Aspergillus ibericus CBS 121593]|uniref:Putative glutathione S-transferase n=1 Tax=Aspergillus ibericus CBS 121593 TaxID=1448316 RepID=A0A395GLF2_9EURO|nr:putative glutathione S-transferase [Aspergillus ibericus CBS 121593]RAK95657.1 putative glutathione S-transferase [Aspergillus ibericus CBS 121593]
MTTPIQPLTLYGKGGPNPPRVAIILTGLALPYTTIPIPLSTVKQPPYTFINPNGRLPALHDPNTNLTIWESGAIIQYLISRYDRTHTINFPEGTNENYLTAQWMFFQASGQGPYYGQASWFKKFHPERVPSAVERYVGEIRRERMKEEKEDEGDGPWLVGGKCSVADLVWVSWQVIVTRVITKEDGYDVEEFPVVKGWLGRMLEREAVRKVMADVEPVL